MNGRTGIAMIVLAVALATASSAMVPFATPAWAAEKAAVQKGKQQGSKKEVTDITANNMEVVDEKNLIIFSGNVQARKGETRLSADRLEVYTEKEEGADDGQGKKKMSRWVATGNVRIVKGDTVITGSRADMDVKRDVVTVTGNVVVKQPDSTIRGSKLVSNLKTNVTRIIAGGKGRVRGVFR